MGPVHLPLEKGDHLKLDVLAYNFFSQYKLNYLVKNVVLV